MDTNDSPEARLYVEVAAHGAATRIALAALFKTHPQPAALLQALREIQRLPGSLDGQMPEPIQARADFYLGELVTQLRR